jgi:hypothetical protein
LTIYYEKQAYAHICKTSYLRGGICRGGILFLHVQRHFVWIVIKPFFRVSVENTHNKTKFIYITARQTKWESFYR